MTLQTMIDALVVAVALSVIGFTGLIVVLAVLEAIVQRRRSRERGFFNSEAHRGKEETTEGSRQEGAPDRGVDSVFERR